MFAWLVFLALAVGAPGGKGAVLVSGEAVREEEVSEPGPRIALTFDDGPGPYTERLLDGLKERGVKASFFLIGMIKIRPARVKVQVYKRRYPAYFMVVLFINILCRHISLHYLSFQCYKP